MQDEQEQRQLLQTYQQEHVSKMLTWVGIEEDRAVYLAAYKNVLRDLADPFQIDWALLRAAMLHIASSESLNLEHSRWLGEEIYASFEQETQQRLYYLTLDTRRERPAPQFDPDEMFPIHRMTNGEAIFYYSRAALAVLVSKSDPRQAIELFEELESIFVPRMRFHLPGAERSLYLDRELDRLPALYERVGRFEDALKFKSVSFTRFGWDAHSADVALRRLEGWLNQLYESAGVAEVERCLDMIYEWMDAASEVDEDERDDISECPTTTRQFWAWYYGRALGRLIVARASLRGSLLGEIEAGEWENCWHVAGILSETIAEPSDDYRKRALKFYNTSDIEYRHEGPRPWGATQPPRMSPQSDLYWAMRVGFADAHLENDGEYTVSRTGIADSLEELKSIATSTALHVLRSERNTERLVEDVQNRVMPNDEYWLGILRERLPTLLKILPFPTIEHLVGASRHKFAREGDDCSVCLCKAVESLFHQVFASKIRKCPKSKELKLVVPRPRNSPRNFSPENWHRIQLSGWARIIETTTERGENAPLRRVLPQAFPEVDLDAVVRLNVDLAIIAQRRGGSAHDSAGSKEQRAQNAEALWDLVVGINSEGFLGRFCSALGLVEQG